MLDRRTERLVTALDRLVPVGDSVLDVGCGNGAIGAALTARSRSVTGMETRARPSCEIPLAVFNGASLPVATDSVDWVMFVDVLHHAEDVGRLVADACRVARRGLIIKDHYGDSAWSRRVLAFMDWVGNRHLDVDLQDNYLSRDEWASLWSQHGLEVAEITESIDLYPKIVKPLFEHGKHFAARLSASSGSATD